MEPFESTDTPIEKKSTSVVKLIIGLVLLSLVTVACLGTVAYFTLGQVRSNIDLVTRNVPFFSDGPIRNQIAFVGNDDNLWLVSPSGEKLRSLTEDGRGYSFPTWAPNGRYLAFVGPGQSRQIALYVSSPIEGKPSIIFDEPGSAPFYLYWSPKSPLITFLTQESAGLAMRQANAEDGSSRLLAEGSPFYWVWSPLGDKLLMHVGGSRAISDEAHISILENREDAKRIQLDLAPGRFQAPDWSADGQYIYYIATNDSGREAIYRMNVDTLEETRVTNLAGFAHIVLSPTDKHIAYLQFERNNSPPLGTAYIVNVDGQNHRRITENPVGSMYWSPDGTKLALLTISRQQDGSTAKIGGLAVPLSQEIHFRWLIYHVETEELEPLISFDPTADFIQTVPFFDQYHLSLTFWSPDSRYFLVTKENANGPDGTIWVVDTTGVEEPHQIGEGRLAVWSWQ
jgi:Tol biopolymer transport system component